MREDEAGEGIDLSQDFDELGQPLPATLHEIAALTAPEAQALLKGALAVLIRQDFNPALDTVTARERVSLQRAIEKLDQAIRLGSSL